MPTHAVALTGSNATDATSYALGSFNLAAGKTYLLGVGACGTGGTDPGVPTLSGPGADFSLVNSVNNPGSVNSRFALFEKRQAGSGSGLGDVNATWSTTAVRGAWILIEITDGDLAAQSVTASYAAATAASAALAALRSANSDVIAFGMHHVNEGHSPGASLGEVADVTTTEAFAVNAMTGDNITTLNVTWASAARGGIIGVEIPNMRSMVSSSTWTVSIGSILHKMKNMVSSSTWTLTIGTILDMVERFLHPTPTADTDTQTLTAASPDTQTLTSASPDTQTLTAASPDSQPS